MKSGLSHLWPDLHGIGFTEQKVSDRINLASDTAVLCSCLDCKPFRHAPTVKKLCNVGVSLAPMMEVVSG